MQLVENNLYHIYNQGNNREIIFRENADYLRFLVKTKILIAPYCDILAYCFMPNHFHFLINANSQSVIEKTLGSIKTNVLSNGFRLLLSEYAQEYNLKYKRTGSLFRQRTKAKCLTKNEFDYASVCFHYIHQNPMKAGLVSKLESWEFSSFNDYVKENKQSVCKRSLCYELLGIDKETFYEESYGVIDDQIIEGIFNS